MRHVKRIPPPGALRRVLGLLTAVVLLTALAPAVGAAARATLRPIVFVHGFFGSGSQFATQAKRFASNGYPASYIEFEEYDSLFAENSREDVLASLDRRIARLKAATGADKVELVGHSLGTAISQQYLNSSPSRAANVAHYVNIDGATAGSPPGGVPTLAVWAEGRGSSSIRGATNVYLPNESHVENASSPATFAAMYEFFTGQKPRTTDVVPESGQIQLAGRAVRFPSNASPGDAVVDVFEIDPATGRRTTAQPIRSMRVAADGSFGPFPGRGDAYYEFLLTRAGTDQQHHLYFEPFRRTDLGIRLLSSNPGEGIDRLIQRGRNHVALLAYRNKEWWGDQGSNSDTLTVNGVSIVNEGTAPRDGRAIGIFAFDRFSDRRSNPGRSFGLFNVLPFMSAVDLYVPASATANGTVTLSVTQRGGGRPTRLTIPNWPSANHTITVCFNDYVS
ncbi:alpha/beta fold hydrolase [uncultured Thermomonospora sp.]|uniref:alpha/beta fold hydrolase n=1 Tax=uncultured Thermomonospora sp. TaxID=671175 RepID=UPI00259BD1A6|nr:alpha/beta fold hydrolase [uncultured Thermomonospora sp.]